MIHYNVFNIKQDAFVQNCLWAFQFQYYQNPIYRQFCQNLSIQIDDVTSINDIPFLPIEFFKKHKILTGKTKHDIVFKSSGTTNSTVFSEHYVADVNMYKAAIYHSWRFAFGDVKPLLFALMPSYMEQSNSSLIYMLEVLKELDLVDFKGYYMYNHAELAAQLAIENAKPKNVILLWGVTFALLDFAENFQLNLKNAIVMETGGMKGRRKEQTRMEIHKSLNDAFGTINILSEYGMTELLSQSYSFGNGIFKSPPWVKVLARDLYDPLSLVGHEKTAGLNIIDLANIYSCPFIATQDIVKTYEGNLFEVLGRTDNADIRGCNLMAL